MLVRGWAADELPKLMAFYFPEASLPWGSLKKGILVGTVALRQLQLLDKAIR